MAGVPTWGEDKTRKVRPVENLNKPNVRFDSPITLLPQASLNTVRVYVHSALLLIIYLILTGTHEALLPAQVAPH